MTQAAWGRCASPWHSQTRSQAASCTLCRDDVRQVGTGTSRIVRPSMSTKSLELQVYSGRPLAIATAAIRASSARAAGLRPDLRSAAAT